MTEDTQFVNLYLFQIVSDALLLNALDFYIGEEHLKCF